MNNKRLDIKDLPNELNNVEFKICDNPQWFYDSLKDLAKEFIDNKLKD